MPLRTPVPNRLRSISLRTSLVLLAVVPTVALGGLWAATTISVLSDGFNLRAENAVNAEVSKPFGDMIQAAARERTLSAVWLADPHASHAALDAQRPVTDAAAAEMSQLPAELKDGTQRTKAAFGPVADAMQQLNLPQLRTAVDARSANPQAVAAAFGSVINAEIVGTDKIFQVDDATLIIGAAPTATLIAAREELEQEDATMEPAVASGRMDPQTRAAVTSQMGARRLLLQILPSQLNGPYMDEVKQLTSSAPWQAMEAIENDVASSGSSDKSAGLPASARQWPATLAVVEPQMQKVTVDPIIAYNVQAHARADSLVRSGLIISGSGLAAILVVALLSWGVARSLLRRLTGLRKATLELAENRLPDVVDRLNRGEQVDVEAEAADLEYYGSDELGQVAEAFNSAQRTALRSAAALAGARLGFQKAILGMARHSQNLVNRQLSVLDTMERKHQDPDVLEGLYELDSQASQMRRYEENLVIISGGQPGRRWTEPVPVIDVMRSALGEVADYQRITVHADEGLMLAAHAVADVIHLLAELMDNATNFSPPICPVWVRSEYVGRGLAIEVEDRGLGMTEEEYREANRKLSEPPSFDVLALADGNRLGFFVVSHLATRHGIRVTLRSSPFGGTSAVLVLPADLLFQKPQPQQPQQQMQQMQQIQPQQQMPVPIDRTAAPAGSDGHSGAYSTERPAPERSEGSASVRSLFEPRSRALPAYEPAVSTPDAAPLLDSGMPPLPQRVPQASLVEELRNSPPPSDVFPDDQEPLPSPEQVSRTMSAFQRGTVHARGFGAHAARNPNSAALTKDPR